MSTDYKREFSLEEYKQNWAYIHQCETVRLKQFQIFFLVVGVFASFLAYLLKGENDVITAITSKYSFVISAASTFLSVFLFCLLLFIFLQKRGYENYRDINKKIKNYMFDIQGPIAKSKWYSLSPSSAFTWWFFTLVVTWFALVSIMWFVAPLCVSTLISIMFIGATLSCLFCCKKT